MRAITTLLLLLAVGLTGLLGIAAWRRQPQHETRFARGDELVLTDFGFAVERTAMADRPGQPDHGPGRDVAVDLRVTNHAKVAANPFLDVAAMLVDEQGRTVRVDAAAHGAARGTDPIGTAIPPGGSLVTHLVFDVPADATGLRLLFDLDMPIANLLEDAFNGRRTLALE